MFNKIGLIVSSTNNNIQTALTELIDCLEAHGRHIILDTHCAKLLANPRHSVHEADTLGQYCDLVIAIGGDGTMLMASRLLCDFNVPLLGVNLGRIGFLADIPADNIKPNIDKILNGDYVEDIRFLLRGQVLREEKCVYESHAFNDVVVQRWNIARLIELTTSINGIFIHTHRSDGMIISTPTGSTAYALAGGGPVIHPLLNALLLVPICPHSLTNRPIIVSGDSCIEVTVETQKADQARLTFDGDIKFKLEPADRIRIKKKDKKIRLIHPPGHDQFHILREKLHWSK